SHPDPVEDDRPGANPGSVLDDDATAADPLVHDGQRRIVEVMVDRQDLCARSNQDCLADGHAALAANDHGFPDEGAAPDPDEGVGQVPKVEDVQLGVVHDEGVVVDVDPTGTGVQVDPAVEVHPPPQPHVLGEGDAH